jgi:transposase
MTKATRKIYAAQFKAKVALEAIQGIQTVNEIAQKHSVHPVQVSQWKKEVQEQAAKLFEKKRGKQKINDHERPEHLYSEIGRLKMELDWLKKKSGENP